MPRWTVPQLLNNDPEEGSWSLWNDGLSDVIDEFDMITAGKKAKEACRKYDMVEYISFNTVEA